jgi:putative peptidoglycan lipid II flippase
MTTMMPELSSSAARRDFPELARRFRLGMRYIVLLMLPAAVLFVALAQPMVGVLVRGGFSAHDAAVTADTLQAFAIGLVPFSVYLFALRGFYALADTRTPFVINAVENVLNVGLALALFPSLGVQGLALAWTGAYSAAAILALVMLGRRVPKPIDGSVGASVARASVAGAALAIVAAPLAGAIGRATANRALVASAIAALAGGIVYVVVLALLRAPELKALFGSLRRSVIPLDV